MTSFFAVGLGIGSNGLDLASLLVCMAGKDKEGTFSFSEYFENHRKISFMTGYSLMTIFFLLLLKETIFIVADINQSRRRVREAVEDLDRAEAGDHEAARLLLREIDNLEPVSGYGLFEVTRGTLTSMVSTSITYLIILIQFKTS